MNHNNFNYLCTCNRCKLTSHRRINICKTSALRPIAVAQIGVIAVEDNTVVRFRFPLGTSVFYNGFIYDNANMLTIMIDRYFVFHVEDDEDLTGTLVTSTNGQSIAVFAGRR